MARRTKISLLTLHPLDPMKMQLAPADPCLLPQHLLSTSRLGLWAADFWRLWLRELQLVSPRNHMLEVGLIAGSAVRSARCCP